MTIHQVTPETWHLVEGHVIRWLKSKHCPHTAQEIIDAVTSGAWTLWAVVAGRKVMGVYAVRIFTTAQGRMLEMPFLVGEKVRQWWQLADDTIEQTAREYGATKILLTGRKGWERVTRSRYRVHSVVIEREVGNGNVI